MLDTVHRGGFAFIVALGIDIHGKKQVLGFWEGATENSVITLALFADLERRKLNFTEYRDLAHNKFRSALAHASYKDAKAELLKLEIYGLRGINPNAANSLLEAMVEVLTLHKLKAPEYLRRVLATTNGIENLFSTTRHREKNLKNYNPNYRGEPVKKNLSQRWLATVFLNAESGFRTVKGFKDIQVVITNIRKLHKEIFDNKSKVAA